jgi:hypothetical protein
MTTVRREMAKAEGAGIQDEDGIERVLAAPPQHGISPSATSWSPPRRTAGKDRPRLRDSLAGGSIRSRRPARESGRNTEWAQIPYSSPPFRTFRCLRSVTAARRAIGKLTALWAGASSGRPAEGHRRRRRQVRARRPTRSLRAWRRSDGRNREQCCMRPIPVTAGSAATHARPPRARAVARVLRGMQRALLRAAGALSAGTASCHRRGPGRGSSRRAWPAGVPDCRRRILTRAAWCHFTAGDGWRCLA